MSRPHRSKKNVYRMRTQLIHGNYESKHWDYDHHLIPPISASAAYRLGSLKRGAQGFEEFARGPDGALSHMPIYIYDRLDEPTRAMLEENLAYAEAGEAAVCFSSGMAAISAAIGITTSAGDEIVAHHTLYGCTYSLLTNWLPRQQVVTRFADLRVYESFRQAVTDRTRVVYCETPVNPTLDLIDIAQLRRWLDEINTGRKAAERAVLIIDNTFATPYCQRPLTLGADLVVQSLTKNIGGFGTDMGGVVICAQPLRSLLLHYRKDFGAILSSKSAWPILVYGLPTLAARMTNQQKCAMHVAQFLDRHEKVGSVSYPGLESFAQRALAHRQMISYDGKFAPGSMIYFVMKGGVGAAQRFIDHIASHAYSITLAVSLGQVRTLIEAPYAMTHASLPESVKLARGIEPGGIRLSIGLEDWHDITEDLERAFAQV